VGFGRACVRPKGSTVPQPAQRASRSPSQGRRPWWRVPPPHHPAQRANRSSNRAGHERNCWPVGPAHVVGGLSRPDGPGWGNGWPVGPDRAGRPGVGVGPVRSGLFSAHPGGCFRMNAPPPSCVWARSDDVLRGIPSGDGGWAGSLLFSAHWGGCFRTNAQRADTEVRAPAILNLSLDGWGHGPGFPLSTTPRHREIGSRRGHPLLGLCWASLRGLVQVDVWMRVMLIEWIHGRTLPGKRPRRPCWAEPRNVGLITIALQARGLTPPCCHHAWP